MYGSVRGAAREGRPYRDPREIGLTANRSAAEAPAFQRTRPATKSCVAHADFDLS